MSLFRCAALGCLMLRAAGGGAQSVEDARALQDASALEEARAAFAEGRFLAAAELAEAPGTSDGYALAAGYLAIHARFVASGDEWREVAERAIQMGDEAVRADSTNAQAHYQSAHALGRYAQGVGTIAALREGLANRIRERLDAAIRLDPHLAEARLALAGWHADIDEAGFVARRMYGGNRAAAVVLFEQALDMRPDLRVVLYEYAIRLPYLDEERGEERARELLAKAAELPVPDAYNEFVQELVLEALAAREPG